MCSISGCLASRCLGLREERRRGVERRPALGLHADVEAALILRRDELGRNQLDEQDTDAPSMSDGDDEHLLRHAERAREERARRNVRARRTRGPPRDRRRSGPRARC